MFFEGVLQYVLVCHLWTLHSESLTVVFILAAFRKNLLTICMTVWQSFVRQIHTVWAVWGKGLTASNMALFWLNILKLFLMYQWSHDWTSAAVHCFPFGQLCPVKYIKYNNTLFTCFYGHMLGMKFVKTQHHLHKQLTFPSPVEKFN